MKWALRLKGTPEVGKCLKDTLNSLNRLSSSRGLPQLLLTLLASCASWAALPPPGPGPMSTCLAPSGVTCNDVAWVARCGPQFGSISQTDTVNNPCLVSTDGGLSLADQGRANWSASHQQGLMTDKVFNRVTDQFAPSMPPPSTPPLNSLPGTTTWAGQEAAAVAAAWKTQEHPLSYVRPGSAKSGTIDTCESYVYRSFYDVERWVDGINACKDNSRCKVGVSLNGLTATTPASAPGIARRLFKNSEDVLISSGPNNRLDLLRSTGKIQDVEADPFSDGYHLFSLPKNSFYVGTAQIFTPALINAFTKVSVVKGQQVGNLLDEVSRASSFYTMGIGTKTNGAWYQDDDGVHQGFADEWEFHQVMNQRNASLTAGETREYRKRNADVLAAFDRGTDAMKCLYANRMYVGGCNPQTINAVGKAHPGDFKLWESDPFESRSMYSDISPYAFTTPPSMLTQIGLSATQLQQSQVSLWLANNPLQLPGMHNIVAPQPAPTTNSGGYVAVTGLWEDNVPHVDPAAEIYQGNLRWMIDRTWTINPPRIDSSSANLRLDCRVGRTAVRGQPAPLLPDELFHTDTVWVEVCEMTNVLLNEWNRSLQGKPSCLDRHSSKCDWSPDDFVDRFVTRNLAYGAAAKEVEYQYCKRWTGGGKLTDGAVSQQTGQLLYGLTPSQRSALSSFRTVLDQREVAFKALLASVPLKAKDDFGSMKSDENHIGGSVFGGGYSYDLGWHAKVMKRDANQQICRLGGSAIAAFDAHATLFTAEFEIIDALATVSANEEDNGKALGQAHLYVVGYEFFDTGEEPISLTGNVTPDALAEATNVRGGEKIRLVTLPFQAGPVTITVTAGISYNYSSALSLVAEAASPTSCEAGNPLYKVTARFTPSADLGAWADADASLAGIVGVGLEVELTLIGLSLPLVAEVHVGPDVNKANALSIIFNAQLDLVMTTMKGQINLYIEALFMKVASFKLVSWPGYVARFPVFRTPTVALQLSQMPPAINPPN